MSSLESALDTLSAYVAAFGEVPGDPSSLVQWAEHNATVQSISISDAQQIISIYIKNLQEYRIKYKSASQPATPRNKVSTSTQKATFNKLVDGDALSMPELKEDANPNTNEDANDSNDSNDNAMTPGISNALSIDHSLTNPIAVI